MRSMLRFSRAKISASARRSPVHPDARQARVVVFQPHLGAAPGVRLLGQGEHELAMDGL
jgi:hypothetical protein